MKKKKSCKNDAAFVIAVAREERYWVCEEHVGHELTRVLHGKGALISRDCSEYAPCSYKERPISAKQRHLYDLMNAAGRALKNALEADRKVRTKRKSSKRS